MHFAAGFHVVIKLHHPRFIGRQRRAQFLQRPGEIIAVVVQRVVGVLAGVKSAPLLVGKHFVHPGDDAFRGLLQKSILRDLPAMQIIFQQLGIVIGHFFKMRHQPFFIHRVAVESAAELVIHSAARHFLERGLRHRQQVLPAVAAAARQLLMLFQNQID